MTSEESNADFIIGYSRAKSPWKIGSKSIQIAECRNYSHVYLRYKCRVSGVWVVAQASHGYVNEVSYDIFKEDNIVVEEYLIKCTEDEFVDIITFIQNNKGKLYDRMALVFIAIKKLLHFEVDIRNRDKEFICSEFSTRVCRIAKIEVPKELDYITPSDSNKITRGLLETHPEICSSLQ
jgi:hypothetical protein